MSDPHDREPVDQATIDGWRVNYGLDKRTPREAVQWWSDNLGGFAPAGAVAALGVALDELDALRAAIEAALPFTMTIGQRALMAAIGPSVGAKATT